MSDFLNQENDGSNREPEAEAKTSEDFSTVFSAPLEHKKTAESLKKRPKLVTVLAGILAVGVLVGGTWGVIKFIPKREDEDSSLSETKTVEVLKLAESDVKGITFTNKNGKFEYYTKTEKSGEDDAETVNWYLKGYNDGVISSSALSSNAASVLELEANMEITQMTEADCGLDKPTASALITEKSGKQTEVLLGKESFDGTGSYLKLKGSDKIYLVSSIADRFEFELLDLASTDTMPSFPIDDAMSGEYTSEDGTLAKFDEIRISGKNFPKELVIGANTDSALSEYANYVTLSPTERIADNVDDVFNIFKDGVSVSGAYALDASAESMKKFGLDDPDITVTMKINKTTQTYKFKLREDGYCAAWCDGEKLIKKVSTDSLSFIDYTAESFYSSWICLNNISDVKELTVITPDKSYSFGIKAKSDDEEDKNEYIVTYNKREIDCDSFKDFYQEVISISCSDFTVDNVKGDVEYSFVFKFNKDIGGENRIDFVKSGDTRFEYRSDGEALGKVNRSDLLKIISSLEELVK